MLQSVYLKRKIFQVYLSFPGIRIVAIHTMVIHQIEMLFGHDGLGFICIDREAGQSKTGQKKGYFTVHARSSLTMPVLSPCRSASIPIP